jgi:hypothetical protein
VKSQTNQLLLFRETIEIEQVKERPDLLVAVMIPFQPIEHRDHQFSSNSQNRLMQFGRIRENKGKRDTRNPREGFRVDKFIVAKLIGLGQAVLVSHQ